MASQKRRKVTLPPTATIAITRYEKDERVYQDRHDVDLIRAAFFGTWAVLSYDRF